MKINLNPTKCNICNGKVIYMSNSKLYGKPYGSGYCYFCTECKSYVGTHVPRPKEAMGLLANNEMREKKKECHSIFDTYWKNEKTSKGRHKKRYHLYKKLAIELGLPVEECHFGYFDMDLLCKAYAVLTRWNDIEEVKNTDLAVGDMLLLKGSYIDSMQIMEEYGFKDITKDTSLMTHKMFENTDKPGQVFRFNGWHQDSSVSYMKYKGIDIIRVK